MMNRKTGIGSGEITKILAPVIWYEYKGDEICWDGENYISLLSGGAFKSLEEIDDFWESFTKAVSQNP